VLTLLEPAFRLAVTVGAVAAAAALGARVAVFIRQPPVVGELIAAISLGPALLGAATPGVSTALFPSRIINLLEHTGHLGVLLFVFFVGMDFNRGPLRRRRKFGAALIAATVAFPLALGVAVVLPFAHDVVAPPTNQLLCVLFVSVALSVTALPILAAILEETSLIPPDLAQLALGCAAATDFAIWAFVGAISALAGEAGPASVAERVGAAAVILVAVLWAGPWLRRAARFVSARTAPVVALCLALSFATALAMTTQYLGVTLILGAFFAGNVFVGEGPSFGTSVTLMRRLNRRLLLPVFFATVSLHIALPGPTEGLRFFLLGMLLLAAATIGKIGGTLLPGRLFGLPLRDAVGLGVLLNTKGLTEIVVLDIGYRLRLISPDALAVLVAVAVVTTLSAAPLLQAAKRIPSRV
jgi:Kef-type K+ transport system membrane component KefB